MELNYEISGEELAGKAPSVVLVHGLFGDLDNLKSLSRELKDDFHVINIDVRNHGQSPWTDTMTFDEMAEDIEELLKKLDIDKAHFLGHSLGGKIVMAFAMRYPEQVASLIAADIAPVSYNASHSPILEAMCDIDLDKLENRKDADEQLAKTVSEQGVRQFLLKNLRKTDDGWSWRLNLEGLIKCYPDLIGAPAIEECYDGPVLFIRGGDSDYVTAEHKDDILQRFPNAELKTIEGTGHWLHAEKPAVFNGLVRRFLEDNS